MLICAATHSICLGNRTVETDTRRTSGEMVLHHTQERAAAKHLHVRKPIRQETAAIRNLGKAARKATLALNENLCEIF